MPKAKNPTTLAAVFLKPTLGRILSRSNRLSKDAVGIFVISFGITGYILLTNSKAAPLSITTYLTKPGGQEITLQCGTYSMASVTAPHDDWLILKAAEKGCVVVDMNKKDVDFFGSSKIVFVGIKFVNGYIRHGSGTNNIRYWYTEHSFRDPTLDGGAALPGSDPYKPIYAGWVTGLEFYGSDFHDIGADGIRINNTTNLKVQGVKMWNFRTANTKVHSDVIQSTGGNKGMRILDSYFAERPTQIGSHQGDNLDMGWERVWHQGSSNNGFGVNSWVKDSGGNMRNTGYRKDIVSWDHKNGNDRIDSICYAATELNCTNHKHFYAPNYAGVNSPIQITHTNISLSAPNGVTTIVSALSHPDNPANKWRAANPYESYKSFLGLTHIGTGDGQKNEIIIQDGNLATLQAAVNNAKDGQVIKVKGTYAPAWNNNDDHTLTIAKQFASGITITALDKAAPPEIDSIRINGGAKVTVEHINMRKGTFITNSSDITVRNITVDFMEYYCPGINPDGSRDRDGSYGGYPGFLTREDILNGVKISSNTKNITVANSVFKGGARGILLQYNTDLATWPENITLENNEITMTCADNIQVNSGRNITIRNNYLHELRDSLFNNNGTWEPEHNDGIQLTAGDGVLIEGNEIRHLPELMPANNTADQGMQIRDGDAIRPLRNLKIFNNVVHDFAGTGINIDSGDNIEVAHNVSYNNYRTDRTRFDGFWLHGTGVSGKKVTNIRVWNNIFDEIAIESPYTDNSLALFSNNIISCAYRVDTTKQQCRRHGSTGYLSSGGANLIQENPQFITTDVNSPDRYKLQSTSPAINSGINVDGAPTQDRSGGVRTGLPDRGAYEFQAATSNPGPAPDPDSYDLIVTAINTTPATPKAGDPVKFNVTVKNLGTAATPAGTIHGVSIEVNGIKVAWSDTHTTSLAPGQSVSVVSNGGPNSASGAWTAIAGQHQVKVTVDYINRMKAESNEANNTLSTSLTVTQTPTPPPAKQGDLNNDGIVNILDFSVMLTKWNQRNNLGNRDLNNDGIVNILDLSILLSKWNK